MAGLYFYPVPRYEFTLQLPGQVIETNGTLATPDRVSWKFTGSWLFPQGYAMHARSVELDLDTQQQVFGRTVIADGVQAESLWSWWARKGPYWKLCEASIKQPT